MVGSTISLECTPHVQSYAMALNDTAALFVLQYWKSKVHAASWNNTITNTITNTNTIADRVNINDKDTMGTKTTSTSNGNTNIKDAKMNSSGDITSNTIMTSAPRVQDQTALIKQQLIVDLEVGVSSALVVHGFPLIALDPHTHTRKFQQAQTEVQQSLVSPAHPQPRSIHTPQQCDNRRNPVACRNNDHNNHNHNDNNDVSAKPSLGCQGVDPCRVLFVKYGGEVLAQDLVRLYSNTSTL